MLGSASLPRSLDFGPYTLFNGSVIQLKVIHHPDLSKLSVKCDLCSTAIKKLQNGRFVFFNSHRVSQKCKWTERTFKNQSVSQGVKVVLQSMVCVLHICVTTHYLIGSDIMLFSLILPHLHCHNSHCSQNAIGDHSVRIVVSDAKQH